MIVDSAHMIKTRVVGAGYSTRMIISFLFTLLLNQNHEGQPLSNEKHKTVHFIQPYAIQWNQYECTPLCFKIKLNCFTNYVHAIYDFLDLQAPYKELTALVY